MQRRGRRAIGVVALVALTVLPLLVTACSSAEGPAIGSQDDLDSIVADASGTTVPRRSVTPIGPADVGSPGEAGPVGGILTPDGRQAGGGQTGNRPGGGSAGSGSGAVGDPSVNDTTGLNTVSPINPSQPVVVDTPEHPASAFCRALGDVLERLFSGVAGGARAIQQAAQEVLDNPDLFDKLTSLAPKDGEDHIHSLQLIVQSLANGEPVTSPLVKLPLNVFSDWARQHCALVR